MAGRLFFLWICHLQLITEDQTAHHGKLLKNKMYPYIRYNL